MAKGAQQIMLTFSHYAPLAGKLFQVDVVTRNASLAVINTFTKQYYINPAQQHVTQAFTWVTKVLPQAMVQTKVTITCIHPGGGSLSVDKYDYITMTMMSAI
jgi:hypothetical protein